MRASALFGGKTERAGERAKLGLHPSRVLGSRAKELLLRERKGFEPAIGVGVVDALGVELEPSLHDRRLQKHRDRAGQHLVERARVPVAELRERFVEERLGRSIRASQRVRVERIEAGDQRVIAAIAQRIDVQLQRGGAPNDGELGFGAKQRKVARRVPALGA